MEFMVFEIGLMKHEKNPYLRLYGESVPTVRGFARNSPDGIGASWHDNRFLSFMFNLF